MSRTSCAAPLLSVLSRTPAASVRTAVPTAVHLSAANARSRTATVARTGHTLHLPFAG